MTTSHHPSASVSLSAITIVAVFVFLTTSCSTAPDSAANEAPAPEADVVELTKEQEQHAGIGFGKAELRTLGVLVPVQGVVDVPPQNLVSISAPMGGYIRTTDLLPGMEVRKGQTLAMLEDPRFIQLQQDYLIAKGRAELLARDHERQAALNASKTTSDKVFQEATTDLNAARIAMSALSEQLQLIGIEPGKLTAENLSRSVALRSPIHGWVSSVNVNIGRYVQPSDVLFELVDPTDLHLALTVFEKDLALVHVGQEVHARPTANPDLKYDAKVILVGRSLDNDRSAVVHCHFNEAPKLLLPGMAMSAELELTTDPTYCVPTEAVVRSSEGEVVFIRLGDGRYKMEKVETGAVEYGYTEILRPRDAVIKGDLTVKGAYKLLAAIKNTAE